MILYFSATGNCKYVAGRIARAIGQKSISIVDCIREDRYSFSDESIGVIAPCYFWGLPSIVKEFLEKASFRTDYLYYIATYGTTPGASDYMAKRAIHGCEISAYYSIRMADTWTPVFDLSTPEKVERFTKTTEAEIDRTIACITAFRTNRHMRPRVPAIIVQWIAQPIYDQKMRRTSKLRVDDSCIGCGLCARKCPVHAIEMQNKRPVWVLEKCTMCLGCLHRCPKFAIQYGRNTRKHGQYTNPNVTL